jgi:hypothetical protein
MPPRRRALLAVLIALAGAGAAASCGHRDPGPAKPAGTSVAGSATALPTPPPTDPPPAPVPASAAPPLDHDYPRLAERAVKLYTEVADAFRTAGDDCTAATAKLGELATAYADVVTANAKVLHEGRARELRPALAKHADQFDAAAKSIVQSSTMAKCSRDPAFTKAFDDLVGAPP